MSMRFKTGLLAGLAGGYILGAKAGRQRYEQIHQAWSQLMESPAVRQATARTRELAEGQTKRALYAVQSGVEKAGSAVKERLGGAEDAAADMREALAGTRSPGSVPDSAPPTPRQVITP